MISLSYFINDKSEIWFGQSSHTATPLSWNLFVACILWQSAKYGKKFSQNNAFFMVQYHVWFFYQLYCTVAFETASNY